MVLVVDSPKNYEKYEINHAFIDTDLIAVDAKMHNFKYIPK